MIYIFHGDNEADSRDAYNLQISQFDNTEILRLDHKTIDLDQINNFINGNTFFQNQKTLAISNFFSISKPIQDKLIKIISQSAEENNIIIWQDKLLNATQLKTFPKAIIKIFKANNIVFGCLNDLKPKNAKIFIPKLHLVYSKNLYDLFLYLVKNSLRKQMTSYSKFNSVQLQRTYLQLIELDFQNKSGQLTINKELALERTLLNLIK